LKIIKRRFSTVKKVSSKPGYDPAIVKRRKTSLRIRENIFIAAELL